MSRASSTFLSLIYCDVDCLLSKTKRNFCRFEKEFFRSNFAGDLDLATGFLLLSLS